MNNKGNVNYGIFLPLLNVYGDQKTIDCFTQEAMFDGWLKAESALAQAEAEESIIPVEMAEKIEQVAHISSLDLKGFWEETRNVGYPIIPLVNRLAEIAGEAGKYVHWGATTQDIMDTGLILQLRPVLNRLEQLLIDFGNACATLCEQHAETIQAGRTHGQQAVPITFGFKVSVWLEEIQRHYLRLQEVKKRLLVGQLSGAAGTLATLGKKAPFVRKRYCDLLGLNEPQGPWHVARDAIVEFSNMEAIISGTVQKIAKEIANLASTEIGEVLEFEGEYRGASSTMPQKSNPISCETVIGLTSISVAMAQGMYGAMTPGYERATGEWQIEWDTIPIVCAGTASSLSLILEVTCNLSVKKDKMRENLELNQGLIMSESVMMLLAEEIGKQKAHELMYRLSKKSSTENKKLQKVLEEDETASKLVNFEKIRSALNPTRYLGEAPDLARKSVENWNSLFPENWGSYSTSTNFKNMEGNK